MDNNTRCSTISRLIALSSLIIMLSLTGCPGDEEGEVSPRGRFNVNAATAAAVTGTPFDFAGAVPVLGTDAATTVTFPTPTTVNMALTGTAIEADGAVVYGSCEFIVTQSTFPVGQGPQVGERIIIPDCEFDLDAGPVKIGSQEEGEGTLVLFLNGVGSNSVAVRVSVNADGILFINGVNTGLIILDNGEISGSSGEGG